MNNYCAQPQAHPDRCGCEPDEFQIARHSKRLVEQQRERIAALEAECKILRNSLAGSNNQARANKLAAEKFVIDWLKVLEERDALAAENARLRAELEQSRDLIVEMSKHCNATALVADWLERNT